MKPCFFFSTKLPRYAVKIGCFITNLFSEQNNRLLVVNTTFSDGGYIYIYATPIYIYIHWYIYIYTYIHIIIHIPRDLQFDLIFTPVLDQFPLRDPETDGASAQALRRLTMPVTTPSCGGGAGATYSEKVTVLLYIDLHIYMYIYNIYIYMYICIYICIYI
jgi:hypothetical protein